jgi:hypothetical protein
VEQLGGSVVWSAESYTLTVKSTKASAGPAAP